MKSDLHWYTVMCGIYPVSIKENNTKKVFLCFSKIMSSNEFLISESFCEGKVFHNFEENVLTFTDNF